MYFLKDYCAQNGITYKFHCIYETHIDFHTHEGQIIIGHYYNASNIERRIKPDATTTYNYKWKDVINESEESQNYINSLDTWKNTQIDLSLIHI